MKTSHIIAATAGITIFIWLVLFKVYSTHRHPTWKSLVKELKLAIAERLIYLALNIMPEGKQKNMLAKFIVGYVDDQWNVVDKNFSFYKSAISNNIPAFTEAIKKENSVIGQFDQCAKCGNHFFIFGPGQSKRCIKCNDETTYSRII